jgi:hypothetical protein
LVELSPRDDPSLTAEWIDGKRYIPRTKEGACIYLGEKGCTVYEIRPATCRFFDCRLYQITGIVYSEGCEKLNAAITGWDTDKLYKTKEDKIRGIATRMAFQHTQNLPNIGGNPILAFAMHESFMAKARKYFRGLKREPKI